MTMETLIAPTIRSPVEYPWPGAAAAIPTLLGLRRRCGSMVIPGDLWLVVMVAMA